jgi:hypothetical protein
MPHQQLGEVASRCGADAQAKQEAGGAVMQIDARDNYVRQSGCMLDQSEARWSGASRLVAWSGSRQAAWEKMGRL